MATQENNTWAQGHLEPWWGLSHRDLSYNNESFNDPKSLREWQSLGYTQKRFTGDMYDMRQPETAWLGQFKDHFQLNHLSWSVYRMRPGDVLPEHADTYNRFCELHGLFDTKKIVRALVFLEDWQSGHYLELNKKPVTGWKAGDWVSWNSDFLHLAANVGKTNRYTLQLTGTV
jgi:hypothetical protein